MQGSDDWLLSRVVEGYMGSEDRTVVSANVGSVAGLRAVAGGKAHLAGCHVDNRKVRDVACRDRGCHLVGLFERHQGIIYDAERHPGVRGLETIVERSMRFAERQPLSGTHRLVTSLFEERDLDITALPRVGPFSEHLGVALAVRTGQADAGVGIRVAAERCGLDFLPLTTERYKLAIPHRYFSQPRITGFLDHVLGAIRDEARKDPAGYDFDSTGRIETISSATAG